MQMALRALLACVSSAKETNDLPCLILHSASRDVALVAARSVLSALQPLGIVRRERHVLPAVDPGRHSTHFYFERAPTSLLIDLSQSEVARGAAVDWIAPIAPARHVQGARRSIVMHCADLLSWGNQNALKKIIESSQSNTLFVLTTSQAGALQSAIISRGVVIRCPVNDQHTSPLACAHIQPIAHHHESIGECVRKALAPRSPAAASKAAREAAFALSKMYETRHTHTFLHDVLESLMSDDISDLERCETVKDMMDVDLQLAMEASIRGSTFTIAMHRALLVISARRSRQECEEG